MVKVHRGVVVLWAAKKGKTAQKQLYLDFSFIDAQNSPKQQVYNPVQSSGFVGVSKIHRRVGAPWGPCQREKLGENSPKKVVIGFILVSVNWWGWSGKGPSHRGVGASWGHPSMDLYYSKTPDDRIQNERFPLWQDLSINEWEIQLQPFQGCFWPDDRDQNGISLL